MNKDIKSYNMIGKMMEVESRKWNSKIGVVGDDLKDGRKRGVGHPNIGD